MKGRSDPSRRKSYLAIVFWILLLCAKGLDATACKRGCPVADRGIFRYRPGSVYSYNFDSVITISLASTNSDETSIKVQGRANVFAEANCGYTVKFERVQVVQSKDGSGKGVTRKFTEGVEKPVQFTMSNGELEPQICVDPLDTDYSINLKRAIISMFQKSNKPHETDIFGVCPTTISSTQNGKIELVTKIRNLNSCKYREVLSNGFVSGLVNERAGIKSTPLLTGDYSQEQEIMDGIVERAELHEDYKFVPLANSQTGAGVRAKVRTTIKRTKTAQGGAPSLNGGVSQSIIFRNPRPVPVQNMDVMKTILTNTVNDMQDHTSPKSAHQLTELIRLMRNAGQQQLSTLYRDVRSGSVHPSKDLARRVFLDALFRAGTDDSVSTIVSLIEAEMNEQEQKLAYLSFNLVENINEKSLETINALLAKNPPKEAYLSIGNLVNKYCRQNECDQSRAVKNIATKFATKLGNCQAQTKQHEDLIVNILKGLRNSPALAGNANDRLMQCTAPKLSARVRVAALQAAQSTGCDRKTQSTAMQIFKNRDEDSEIRIEAYLTLVSCPNAELAGQIAEIVNTEPVYQVGGFIVSHLRSIRDSTDTYREASRQHFSNIRITKKFPIDPRRYSFNQELSYSMESLGMGASADYSLIYSQRGFLPRSARLNLTAEIFGHDFNMLDISARQENLELLMEHYFGPKGFFTEREHRDASRQKRAISRDSLNGFAQKFKQYGQSADDNLLFDYSVKMFGSEMVFLSLGEQIPADSNALFKKLQTSFEEVTDKAKNFEYDCGSHSLFLDSELVYPTGMGFPLQMIAQGAGVGRIHFASNINFLTEDWKNDQYRMKFVPSMTVDVNAQMKIDAQVLSTGLKVRGSLHTSTGSDVTVKVQGGKDYTIDIEVPFKKQEIINFNHEIEFVVEDPTKETVHVPLGGRRKDATTERCFDQLSLFGLTVCGIISRPVSDAAAPGFPLNGPTKISFSLETEKKIRLNLSNRQEEGKQFWILAYDTPGSQRPHNTEVKFELGTNPKWYGRVSFKHPEKFLALEAGLQNDNKELAVYGQYEHDRDVSQAKLGFKKTGPNEYEPLIAISGKDKMLDNIAGYRAAGKIVAQDGDNGKRYQFQNIQIFDPTNRATVLNGWVEFSAGQQGSGGPAFNMDMRVRNPENKEYNVKSKFVVQPGHYVASATVLNGANPSSSGSFSLEVQHQEGQVKSDLSLGYGANLKYMYELHNEVSYEHDKTKPRFVKFKNNFVSKTPSANLRLNGQYSQNLIDYDLEGNFGRGKIGSTLVLRRNQKFAGDYDADFTAQLNNHKAEVKARRTIQDGNSLIDHNLKTSWGLSGSVKGKYSNRMTPTDSHVDIQGSLQLSDSEEPLGFTVVLNATPKNVQGNTKVTRGSTELLASNANYIRGDNPSSKFDINIKDLLVGKGEAKWKGGVGDLSFLVNFKKLGRKLKAESKFAVSAPTYNVDATIFYDFEKDNSKKITFNTNNKVERDSIDSNSVLELGTDKYSFAVKGQYSGDALNGNVNGNFKLGLPNGRQIDGEIDRKAAKRDDATEGYARASLTDSMPDGKKRSLQLDSKFSGVNPKARFFDMQHKFTYTNPEGQNGIFGINVKHMPKGEHKTVEATVTASGSMLAKPVEMSIQIEEYSKAHAVYRLNGKYGNDLSGNMNGNYNIGGRAAPATYEVSMHLDAPNTQTKTFQFVSSGRLLSPEVEGGVYDGEININEKIGDKSLVFKGSAKGNGQHGSWSVEYDAPKLGPGKFEGGFVAEEKDDIGKYALKMIYDYGQGRSIKMSTEARYMANKVFFFNYVLETPDSRAKQIEITFKGEKSDSRTYNGHLQLRHNENVYGLTSVSVVSDSLNSLDVTYGFRVEHDNKGSTSRLYGSIEYLGDRKGRTKLKVENLGDFAFDGSAEASAQSFENFYFKADLDSKKLNLDQVHIEANSQPKSGGKGVEFKGTAGGKNILSGSAEYSVKHDKNKVIIDGQGNMQLYEKPRQVSFKVVRQAYEMGRDSEAGYSIAFNGLFGPKNVVSEFKMTNKNFIVKLSACEDKKQCSVVEVRSVTMIEKEDNIQNKIMVLFDLREMGWPHQFELQSKTGNVGFRVEHEATVVMKAENNVQYEVQTYLRQKESGVIVKTPKRTFAVENVFQIPSEVFGKYEASSTLYPNKDQRPDEKSVLSFTGELGHTAKTAINMIGKLHFEHPNVKPLTVTGFIDLNSERKLAQGTFEFDLFKKPSQKIIATSKYTYTDLSTRVLNVTVEASIKTADSQVEYGFDGHAAASLDRYEMTTGASIVIPNKDLRTSGFVSLNTKSFEIVTVAFNEPIFNAHGSVSPKESELVAQYNTFGGKPVKIRAKSQGLTNWNMNINWRDQLTMDSKIFAGKESSLLIKGAGKDLFQGGIALDSAHFLNTQYKINSDEIKAFMKQMEDQTKQDGQQIRAAVERKFNTIRDGYKKQVDMFKNSLPDYSALQATYERNMKEILDEISADPTLHNIVEFYKRIFEALSRVLSTVIKTFSDSYQKLSQLLQESYENLSKLFSEQFLPIFQKSAENISMIIQNWYNEVFKLVLGLFESISKTLKNFEGDFNRIGKAVAEYVKQFSGAFNKLSEVLQKEFEDVVRLIQQFIESLPQFEEIHAAIKKYIGNMDGLRQAAHMINDILLHTEDLGMTQEFKDFTRSLHAYVGKKLKQDDVNDLESLKNIIVSFVNALRSIVLQFKTKDMSTNQVIPIPFSLDFFRQIPFWATFKFSPINFLKNEQWSSLRGTFAKSIPVATGFPFELRGHVAEGQHVFTFDGRHITFPGSCSYVLVQDMDNKFSVVANLQNGKMASVTLTDKSNMIELLPEAQIKLNGKAAEMPVHNKDTHAWRRYYSMFALSEYGVEVKCSLDLRVCHVHVSGFYTGKTRGILGNGNNEPYDDFTLPNGKVTENYADFGNSYALAANCPPVSPVNYPPHEKSDPICSELFDEDSNLVVGYLFIDPSGYFEACNHAVKNSQDKLDAACNIALTYASAARALNIPVDIPQQCLKCQATDRKLGDSFEARTPQKKADIVFVVDTGIEGLMNDLVQNVITDLKTILKQRDMTDVRIAVIVYNENMRYPQLLTTNGKLDFTGKLDKVDLRGAPSFDDRVKTELRRLPNLYLDNWEKLVSQAVASSDARAFNLAMDFPFRPDANRAVIAVRNDQLQYSNFLKLLGAAFSNEVAKSRGIALHLIGPVKEFELTGRSQQQNNVVGFDKRIAVLLSDAKKRANFGSADIRGQIRYSSDMGVEFVQDDNGYVFVLQNFKAIQDKPKERKQYTMAVAVALSDQIARTELINECVCSMRHGLIAEERCKVKQQNLLPPQVKKPAARG